MNVQINDDLAAIMIGTPQVNANRRSPMPTDDSPLRRSPRDKFKTELSCPMTPVSRYSKDDPTTSYYNFTGLEVNTRLVANLTEKRVGPKITSGLESQKVI